MYVNHCWNRNFQNIFVKIIIRVKQLNLKEYWQYRFYYVICCSHVLNHYKVFNHDSNDTPSSYLHVSLERSLYARYNFIFTIAFIHLYGYRIVLQCKLLFLTATIITIAIILYGMLLSFVVSHYENYKYAQYIQRRFKKQ